MPRIQCLGKAAIVDLDQETCAAPTQIAPRPARLKCAAATWPSGPRHDMAQGPDPVKRYERWTDAHDMARSNFKERD
jgi:hypothetical protein